MPGRVAHRRRFASTAGAAAIVTILLASGAHAQAEDRVAVRVAYDGSEGCPPASAFAAEVTARTARVRLVPAGEPGRELRVRVRSGAVDSHGTLEIEGGGSREVRGATCAEVVSALALVSALAFDPHAETGPVAAAPLASAEPAPAKPPEVAPPPASPPAVPRAGPVIRPTPAAPPAERPQVITVAAGAELDVTGRAAPRVLVGGGPFLEVRGDAGPGWAARASFVYSTTGQFDEGPGGAVFTSAVGRVAGCVPLLRPTAPLSFAPCAEVEAGGLTGAGLARGSIVDAHEAVIPWFAGGLSGLIRLDVAGLVVTEVHGGVTFPWVRQQFVFETPDVTVHEVPALVWRLGAGVGLRFP